MDARNVDVVFASGRKVHQARLDGEVADLLTARRGRETIANTRCGRGGWISAAPEGWDWAERHCRHCRARGAWL